MRKMCAKVAYMVMVLPAIKQHVFSAILLIVGHAQTRVPAQNAALTMNFLEGIVTPVPQINIQMAQLLALHVG